MKFQSERALGSPVFTPHPSERVPGFSRIRIQPTGCRREIQGKAIGKEKINTAFNFEHSFLLKYACRVLHVQINVLIMQEVLF